MVDGLGEEDCGISTYAQHRDFNSGQESYCIRDREAEKQSSRKLQRRANRFQKR